MIRLAAIAVIGILSATGMAHGLMAQPAASVDADSRTGSDSWRGPAYLRGSETSDAKGQVAGDAEVTKAVAGHFWADGQVYGRRGRFLVDTGATTVTLTGDDAKRLGLDLASLSFDIPVHTAHGEGRAARVHLAALSVGSARVEDVDAMVVRQGLSTSLLGMSYLGRLSRFEATPEALILHP